MEVLDLFSAAAGGWSLGMHRAGFRTVAACEWIDWRRTLYLQNNPGVRMYDDVRTLTGEQLLRDLGFLPGIVVGSPPCQDISSANTKGKGVEGERSGLYFEAIRIIDEVRPRWFALENSSNLRTRGADAVLAALEAIGYSCWSFVVRASDIGANHERPRSWLIGCDIPQVTDPDYEPIWRSEQSWAEGQGRDLSGAGAAAGDFGRQDGSRQVPRRHGGMGEAEAAYTDGDGRSVGWQGRRSGVNLSAPDDLGHTDQDIEDQVGGVCGRKSSEHGGSREPANADEERRPDGQMEPRLRAEAQSFTGRHHGWSGEITDGSEQLQSTEDGQVGLRAADSSNAYYSGTDWSLDDLAHHLRVDAGLSAWVAQSRIAVGGPRGTSAASLIVEAFGDAVVPQIPEAIGRAILRTEEALRAIYSQRTAA